MDNSIKQRINYGEAVLLAIVIAIVPLLVSVKRVKLDLSKYNWFGEGETRLDFFLYWKGIALLIVATALVLIVFYRVMMAIRRDREKLSFAAATGYRMFDLKIFGLIGAYTIMVALSLALSNHKHEAIWGGYDQWEGSLIIMTYIIIFVIAALTVNGERELGIIKHAILWGVFALALLSAPQAFGHDFFRTELGNKVLTFMSNEELKISFNFENGRVYSTMFNPNYVGSYVALMFPIIASFIWFKKNISDIVKSVIAIVTCVLLIIMLVGSESLTGMVALGGGAVIALIVNLINPRRNLLKICGGAAAVAILVIGVLVSNREVFNYGINKIFNSSKDNFFISKIEDAEDGIVLTTQDGELMLTYNPDEEAGVTCDEGDIVPVYDKSNTYTIEGFEKIQLTRGTFPLDNRIYMKLGIDTPGDGHHYSVVMVDDHDWSKKGDEKNDFSVVHYRYCNAFGKLDDIRDIKTKGFKNHMHFASRRGYIWSRTLPLLGKHAFVGCGSGTFVYEFPNYDYVGLENVGYSGSVVTKPHNMYLQIFVQNGLLGLLAFVGLFLVYVFTTVGIYRKGYGKPAVRRMQSGILVGTFSYMLTGLANDSVIAVAPLFWCLVGVGVGINVYCASVGKVEE
ncbi:O-antigen ligase family protein [Eubacterium xylanophilum]|uniref:O-antigen ligase family protein n=1 Tax=Eubacterium xylanophilum TaxID=39497 RepID=UPI000478A92C|nr:O-antigen ligase family protein [Eubacterium xylanophilum]